LTAPNPKYNFSGNLHTDAKGYGQIAAFYHYCCGFSNCSVSVNFDGVNFLEANLSAPLLSVAHLLKKERNLRFFTDYGIFGAKNLGVLHRNGFARHFCGLPWEVIDDRESTIPIKAFKVDDADSFAGYIERDLFRHRGLQKVPHEVVKKLKGSFYEIFDNVGIHAETTYPVIACGQYFPAQRELKFSLSDLGVGFLTKIANKTVNEPEPVTTADTAISWAVKGGSTKAEASGGNGLRKILAYCLKNNGSLHIYSDGHYWAYDGPITGHKIPCGPRGATISLVFRNI
jgi:hypothetical protein